MKTELDEYENEYEQFILEKGQYQEVLDTLIELLTVKRMNHYNIQQEKFDKLLLRLEGFKIRGFNYKFFYGILEDEQLPLGIRQRLQRLLKESNVVKPFKIATRKYYMSNGVTKENPILNRNFSTSYNVTRKTYFFFSLF